MSAEQLSALILDLYSARKDAKDYLDFFVDPNIEKRLDKARVLIDREMARVSRGRLNVRITRIKATISYITSLGAGEEADAAILLHAIGRACSISADIHIKESLQAAFSRLLERAVIEANTAGTLSLRLPALQEAVDRIPCKRWRRSSDFKELMHGTIADALSRCSKI